MVKEIDFDTFMTNLSKAVDASRMLKARKMLKADRFQLFIDIQDDHLVGVVKSQTDRELVYSARLAADGNFACCTQNLNACGGLRGKLCKHLLVLVIGIAKGEKMVLGELDAWIAASRFRRKPMLDKDIMSEALLKYKGAEAGEVDWRPIETIPEDYYAL